MLRWGGIWCIPAAIRRSNQRSVFWKWFTISGSGPPSKSSSTKRSWSKRLKMQLMTYNVNFNISHELTGNNSITAIGCTINHPEKQPGCTVVAHRTRINMHPSEIKSALRKENTDTYRNGIYLSLIRANAGTQVLYKSIAISDTGVHFLNLIDPIFLC